PAQRGRSGDRCPDYRKHVSAVFPGIQLLHQTAPFDASLFVDIRKRLGEELISEMNDEILEFSRGKTLKKKDKSPPPDHGAEVADTNQGEVIYDATACPQDIAYPTDLRLLSKSREITEAIIDELHEANRQGRKP